MRKCFVVIWVINPHISAHVQVFTAHGLRICMYHLLLCLCIVNPILSPSPTPLSPVPSLSLLLGLLCGLNIRTFILQRKPEPKQELAAAHTIHKDTLKQSLSRPKEKCLLVALDEKKKRQKDNCIT